MFLFRTTIGSTSTRTGGIVYSRGTAHCAARATPPTRRSSYSARLAHFQGTRFTAIFFDRDTAEFKKIMILHLYGDFKGPCSLLNTKLKIT